MNFNELTPAETERLALLAEEAGEVVQIVGKILRHGYASCNPFDDSSIAIAGELKPPPRGDYALRISS